MSAPAYEKLAAPKTGTRITVDANGQWAMPDDPIVCLLKGDGIGADAGGAPGINAVLEARGEWVVIVLSNFDPPVAERIGIALANALAR